MVGAPARRADDQDRILTSADPLKVIDAVRAAVVDGFSQSMLLAGGLLAAATVYIAVRTPRATSASSSSPDRRSPDAWGAVGAMRSAVRGRIGGLIRS